MQRLGLPISKSLDKFKSLYGTTSGTAKPLSSISARQTTDSVSSGSFANLKLTAGFDADFVLISSFFVLLLISIASFCSYTWCVVLFVTVQRNWWRNRLRWRLILKLLYDFILFCDFKFDLTCGMFEFWTKCFLGFRFAVVLNDSYFFLFWLLYWVILTFCC
jgi:hypothetical protein